MKPIELNYIEKNGLLYPEFQISNDEFADKEPNGKYGMMWLRFMKEGHYDRYVELRMSGELMPKAHKINDETHEMIDSQLKYFSRSIDRLVVESNFIREFVLKIR